MRPQRQSRPCIGAAALIAAMLLASSGWAGDAQTPAPETGPQLDRFVERELDRLFGHLQGVLEDLPRYALPEVTEDGDIIIRRLPRRPESGPLSPKDSDDMVDL